MNKNEMAVVADIISAEPYIFDWQDELDEEQEKLIKDLITPAKAIVEKLIDIDNKRIDLCNLKVLYAFMERAVDGDIAALTHYAEVGFKSPLFSIAIGALAKAGYTPERVKREFAYLFKRVKKLESPTRLTEEGKLDASTEVELRGVANGVT